MSELSIGRLMSSNIEGFIVGCRVNQIDTPVFGGMVTAPLVGDSYMFGLIYNMQVDDDGIVKQLVTADNISESVMNDNRDNRLVPVEIRVLAIGHNSNGKIYHNLPPRPPLSLDEIHLCADEELISFTSSGKYGYFRHILRNERIPITDVLAAHISITQSAYIRKGITTWKDGAIEEIITLLRDDYSKLMTILNAIRDMEHDEVGNDAI